MDLLVSALADGLRDLVKLIEERFGSFAAWVAVVSGILIVAALMLWLIVG